jgi:hypothetical protein
MAQTKKEVKKTKKGNTTSVTSTTKKNGNTHVITKTIVIDSDKPGNDGVHPDDVGNEEHINKMMKEAMEGIDWQNIGNNVNVAVAGVDWDKIGKEVSVAVNGVNWDDMSKDISVAMAGVNWDEIKKELADADIELKNIDWDEIHKELKEAGKELNDPKLKKQIMIDMQNAKKDHATAIIDMRRAKADMEDAKKEMEADIKLMHSNCGPGNTKSFSYNSTDFDEMLDKMDRDGLLDRNEKFNVKRNEDGLYINGKKQPASVAQKYSDYMGDEGTVSIAGSKGNLNINVNK